MTRSPKTSFAERLAQACRYHASAPADYGQQAWVRRELAKLDKPVSSTAVSNWFAGYTQPQPEMAEKLAQILAVDARWLLGDERHGVGTGNPTPRRSGQTGQVSTIDIPVPVRPGVIVRIVGIPADVTTAEAHRIANVIRALAPMSE